MPVFLRHDTEKAINEVLHTLCEISKTSKDSILKNEKKMILKTPLQSCIEYEFKDKLKRSIQKILVDYCFKAESRSPGSFVKTLHLTKEKYVNGNLKKVDSNVANSPNVIDVKNMLYNMSDDHVLNSMIFEAISLAGFKGNISIEKSLNLSSSVELIDGYTFKHHPICKLKPIKLVKPKIVFIDGYIESVSEINNLFQEACETKHALVLIARGMHDEVVTTCKLNRDRHAMFVYPLVVKFDINGINTLNDMCVVSGCLPISQNLGNLISSTSLKDAGNVDECFIINDSVVIRNAKTSFAVRMHVKSLVEKRNYQDGIEDLLSERIKSLTNSNVIIRLPDDALYVHKSQLIDYTLRSFKSMLDYGVKDNGVLFAIEYASDVYSNSLVDRLKSISCSLTL